MRTPFFMSADDLVFVMTDKCNSDCIMCPESRSLRINGQSCSSSEWDYAMTQLPDNASHITITGGEPFLEKERLFSLMDLINNKYHYTNVLILTNGKALASQSINREFQAHLTDKYRIAIPVHASNS